MQVDVNTATLLTLEPRRPGNRHINLLGTLYALIPETESAVWIQTPSEEFISIDIQEFERPSLTVSKDVRLMGNTAPFRIKKGEFNKNAHVDFSTLRLKNTTREKFTAHMKSFYDDILASTQNVFIETGYNDDTVFKCLKSLEFMSYISRVQPNDAQTGKFRSNVYQLFPKSRRLRARADTRNEPCRVSPETVAPGTKDNQR